MLALPKYVHRVQARGRVYYYFQYRRSTQVAGQRIRLPGTPQQPEFWERYRELVGMKDDGPRTGTFDALILAYRNSPEFKEKKPGTRREYGRHLDFLSQTWGHLLVRGLKPRHVLELRDGMASTPGKANHVIRVLSLLITWGIPRDYCDVNPCASVGKLKTGKGYDPWPVDAIELFRAEGRPEIWLACALALYTGQRQSDVLQMKWSDIDDGAIQVTQDKTGKKLWIPIHAELREVLKHAPKRSICVCTNRAGKPWTQMGFRASLQKEYAKPELAPIKQQRLVFHGLRKSAVVMLLEAGATDAQVSAITGQTRQMVEHYGLMVNQRRLARDAILKWEESGDHRNG